MSTPPDPVKHLARLVQRCRDAGQTMEAIAADMGASSPLLSQWLKRKLRPGGGFQQFIRAWSRRFGPEEVIELEHWLTGTQRRTCASIERRSAVALDAAPAQAAA